MLKGSLGFPASFGLEKVEFPLYRIATLSKKIPLLRLTDAGSLVPSFASHPATS